MKPNPMSLTRRTMLAGAVALSTALLAASAGAQTTAPGSEALSPPVPTPPQKMSTNYLALAEAFLLGALVVGVNFIPSKRGHQD